MVKKESKRVFESETLILPAIRMVLTGPDSDRPAPGKNSGHSRKKRPNQKTVLKIIEALNKNSDLD
jgi:hypothetical protein